MTLACCLESHVGKGSVQPDTPVHLGRVGTSVTIRSTRRRVVVWPRQPNVIHQRNRLSRTLRDIWTVRGQSFPPRPCNPIPLPLVRLNCTGDWPRAETVSRRPKGGLNHRSTYSMTWHFDDLQGQRAPRGTPARREESRGNNGGYRRAPMSYLRRAVGSAPQLRK